MPEQSEDLLVRGDLALHLIFNLRAHQRKLLVDIMRVQITADLDEFQACLVHLALTDQLTRRVRHEGCQPNEHDHAPGYLDPQWQSPLQCSVGSVAAGESNPVGHHCAKRDPTAGDAADQTTVLGRADLGEIDGDGRDHSSVRQSQISSVRKQKGIMQSAPDSKTSQNTSSKEHADVDRCSLDDTAHRHHHTHQLHESDTSQPVTNSSLRQGAHRLTCDIDRNDLEAIGQTRNIETFPFTPRTAPVSPLEGCCI
jgi:hypothetical protein